MQIRRRKNAGNEEQGLGTWHSWLGQGIERGFVALVNVSVIGGFISGVFVEAESRFRITTRKDEDAMAMKNPPHPGDFIRSEIIAPAGLTVTAAAAALGVSRPALSSLLNGKASLSGEMGLRIEKAFGVRMDTLMRMQSAYEIAQTRMREKTIRVGRVWRAA